MADQTQNQLEIVQENPNPVAGLPEVTLSTPPEELTILIENMVDFENLEANGFNIRPQAVFQ
ncbi:hypothetical protein A2U01_0069161, partial [Trifolium medium]|nr:hypothetical protein [Trifolium medium]